MNEIKQAVIFSNSTGCSAKLERLISQIQMYNIDNILLIGNTNEFSSNKSITVVNSATQNQLELMKIALNHINGPFVTFHNNMLLENDLVKYVLGADFDKKNVLFTTNSIESDWYVESDEFGHVKKISKHTNTNLKFTNILRISDISCFKNNIDNKNIIDIIDFEQASIEYFYFSNDEETNSNYIDYLEPIQNISLVDINKLTRIENHSKSRVNELKNNIIKENKWTIPIIVEKNDYMILDGHHRYEVAKLLELKKIPAILVDYNDIKVWSLRKEIQISQDLVKKHAIVQHEIYPYKTVKHKFPFVVPKTNYMLGELRND